MIRNTPQALACMYVCIVIMSEKSQKANVSQYEPIFGYKSVSGRGRLPVSKMFNKFDQLGPSPIFPVSAVQ